MEKFITEIFECNDCNFSFVILKDGNELPDIVTCPICNNETDFSMCTREIIINKLSIK